MLEWLPLFSLCTWSPQLLSVSLSLQDLEGTERLMSQLLQDPTRNAFWQLQEQQDTAQRCCCNCTWLRHEKVIICCQERQGVSVRQELIRYWLPPECSLTHSLSVTLLYKVDSQRKRETAEVGEQRRKREGSKREGVGLKATKKWNEQSKNRLKTVNVHTPSSEALIALCLPLHKPRSFIMHAQIALNYT